VLFEIRSLAQNLVMGIAPVRRVLYRFGNISTGMDGDLVAARARLESYRQHVDIHAKDILELGPGHTAEVLVEAHRGGAARCVGLDVERHADAHGPIELQHYGGRRKPFADATFDIAWSSDVMEHVRLPDLTMSESFRVLRPGGWFLAAIDLRDHYFLDREEKWLECLRYPAPLWVAMTSNRSSFVNRLRASEWRELFARVGFSIEKFEEKESEILRSLHSDGRVRRFGAPLSTRDAPIYRLEVALRKPVS
jgi:SAM-dependent methyltransferase